MKMQRVKQCVLVAAVAASAVSCGDVVRDGRSPVYVVVDQLLASRGAATPGAYSGTLISDVITNVTTGGGCSTSKPCPTVFDDFGRVTLRMSPKDIGPLATGTVPSPSLNNEVTINRYRIAYVRADGRNTPGVDVPYGFDGAATGTIPSGGSLTLDFELVRHVAKKEPPLVALASNPTIIGTIAQITFYGRDQVGNEVTATGQILIEFGDFGDPS
jgi:hypothetical protein